MTRGIASKERLFLRVIAPPRSRTTSLVRHLSFLFARMEFLLGIGGHRDELRTRVLDRLSVRTSSDDGQLDSLRSKVAGLDKEIQHGTRRLLRAPDDIADLLAGELSNMKRERDRLAAELEQLEASVAPMDVEAEADAVVDKLWTLADELQRADPARLRELIRRMVARIDLWLDHVPKGNRVECPLSRGVIELRPDEISYRLDSRGDPRFTERRSASPRNGRWRDETSGMSPVLRAEHFCRRG